MSMETPETPETSAKQQPVVEARETTDATLSAERAYADNALRAKLAKGEREAQDKVEQARGEVDELVGAAKEQASRQVLVPEAEQSKLRQTVEKQKEALSDGDGGSEAALEAATAAAEHVVAVQAAKAEDAVKRVAHRAEEALDKERVRVDQLTEKEREDRKRAFLEVLDSERRKTDHALEMERFSSDDLVRRRDDVLAVISHDLRNYLNVVGMKAAMLKKVSARDTKALHRLIDAIKGACDTMVRWANDLVDLSSIEAGAIRLDLGVHDAGDLILRATEDFMPVAEARGIQLTTRFPASRPRVSCDQGRVTQILLNLLDNAMKFIEEGGEIRVELADEQAGFVTLSVADTGPGISEADQEMIFERFWHARKGRAGGTGLGLYISKRIVEAHGGRIWVDSRVDQGTTVLFTIPAAESRTG
jgi:signal transduction histidine kinase